MTASDKPHYTKMEITLELMSMAALLVFLIFTIFNWGTVPQRIPDHFDWSGMPDSWGSKGAVPIMMYITVFIFVFNSFKVSKSS